MQQVLQQCCSSDLLQEVGGGVSSGVWGAGGEGKAAGRRGGVRQAHDLQAMLAGMGRRNLLAFWPDVQLL